MTLDLQYSRPVAAIAHLGDLAPDHHRFMEKRVLLTGEQVVLDTANGRECLLNSLRLLIRICPNVTVSLPASMEGLFGICKAITDRIAFGVPVEYACSTLDFEQFDAILSAGITARQDFPWTVINSHGWLARISSGQADLPSDCQQSNPIAALAAACLGVAEVFKRLIALKEERGRPVDGLAFSLNSYCSGETNPGPQIPETLPLDLLLVGVGAIGNGIIHLLSQLPTSGRIWVVDPQTFQPENLGTCLLIGPSDVGKEKAKFAEDMLCQRFEAKGFSEAFVKFRQRIGKEIPYPQIILNGLDNIGARHQVQNLWPDLIIDGAISEFGCQVSRHPWGADIACLICLFQHPPGESAEQVASRATGLSVARMQQAEEPITEDDVRAAPSDKREWLRAHIGHQTCSVVGEGVAQQISQERLQQGFEPSVPFVACLSASMVIAELVKTAAGWPTPLEPRFQFDVLRGPAHGLNLPQERRQGCVCVARKHNIETIRHRHAE